MEPIFVGVSDPWWFLVLQASGSLIGIAIIAIVTWKIAIRRIKADLDIKTKETEIFKNRVFIEKKVDILNDIEKLQGNAAKFLDERNDDYLFKVISVRERLFTYVIDDDSAIIAHNGVLAVQDMTKFYKEALNIIETGDLDEEDRPSKTDDLKNKVLLPGARLRISLEMIHKRLAYNLGFNPNKPSDTDIDIENKAKDLLGLSNSQNEEM